ncbi:hypothetical protein BGZ99_007005 [Dissophora globulifera]|uniref:ABC transporter domain-containing protein n=1 Tax=Dissophora globulifera TaxID=979702 RepID=A0A9P6URL4_9FUNG|nr:hypothetical protein BGZ99_007005 [Dissophora globulifera]
MNGPDTCTSGIIMCNGTKDKKFWSDANVGYLQQNDFLMPYLTVRETLNYAANLRLPRTMSSQKKCELVDLVLLELGLKDCANTRVGEPDGEEGGIQGISGGERRRVSAGIQLLTNPKMLLCDEVTSGLDAFSSFEVIKSLTKLAKSTQKTIVISIHQPRSEIFKFLSESDGQMVLLSRGDVIYSGPIRSVLPWIESTGIGACPAGVNPFDYLLDLSMVDFSSEAIAKSTAVRRQLLVQTWAQREKGFNMKNSTADISMLTGSGDGILNKTDAASSSISLAVDFIPEGAGASLWSQIRVLTSRGWNNQIREKMVLMGCICECVVMGLAIGAIFYDLDDSLGGIRSRSSLAYAVGGIQSYLMLMILIHRFSKEIVVYDRERMDRCILISNEFTDNRFACPHNRFNDSWDPNQCAPWDGNSILRNQLDTRPHHYLGPIVQMVCCFIGFLIVAWLALTVNVVNPTSMSTSRTAIDLFLGQAAAIFSCSKPTTPSGPELSSCNSLSSSNVIVDIEKARLGETRLDVFSKTLERKDPVSIRVEGLSLSASLSKFDWSFLGTKRGHRQEKIDKQLLKDVDLVFLPGKLTAIIGGSGVGKTNLLNVLLRRTSSDLKMTGSIYYNNTKNPSLQMINSVSSYVRQNDDHLLSHLTVRETLRFAAELRMGGSMSRADKYARVEDIVDLIGLRECADVIVGNSAVKGCSGGQRRRVSIGIQLVTEPACLFLDEPTSGLDSLTAKAVVLTLKRIAASGRTVVCTIHQPRADIWQTFDNVVLLVAGGRAAYSGRADKVVEYFAEAGHVVPTFTNVPDFILDTASVNLRSTELEEETRKIVNALVDQFNTNKRPTLASLYSNEPLGELAVVNPQFASFKKSFPILTRRSFINTFRQKGLYFNRICQPVIVAIIITIFFAPLGNGPRDVTSRFGLLQETSPIVFTGMLNNVALYPFERDIAYREISDGGYSTASFFLSFFVNEIPLEIIGSLGVTISMLVITQMKVTVVTFFSFWVIMFGYINAGESIGLVFSTLTTNTGFNITVMSAVLSIFAFMTGIVSPNMPQWLNDINYISLFKYGSVIITQNELNGRLFDCSKDDITSGACPYQTGESVLEVLNFQDKNWTLYMSLFVTIVVAYRLLAWLVLMAKAKINGW